MADLFNFNANNVDPNVGFDAIPEGTYNAIIIESENKATKRGDGSYLELKFQILDGEYAGRPLWTRLNLDNPNDQAVKLAQAELSAICHAVKIMTPKDSQELHNLPLQIEVKCKKREDNGEMTNEIKGYHPKNSVAGQTQNQSAGGQSAPWAGNA